MAPEAFPQMHANAPSHEGENAQMKSRIRWVFSILAAAAFAHVAEAADVADFYKGNTIRLISGGTAGSGIDVYTRLLGRHLGDNIPGNPTVIVSVLDGAASLRAAQSLETSPKDGTYIVGINPGNITLSVLDPDVMKFRFNEVRYLGSISSDIEVCVMWKSTGIKTFDDLRKRPAIHVGATAAGGTGYMATAIVRNLFAPNIHQVLGYPGKQDEYVAIERGELDGDCGTWDTYPRDWIENDKLNVVLRLSKGSVPGTSPPYIMDMATAQQKQIMDIVLSINDMQRPYIVSKQVPVDRLAALRQAFIKTVTSSAFLEDAKRLGHTVEGQMTGDEVTQLVDGIYATPSDIVKQAREVVK
jgi:tripartite-type tricarboxylate transporter receptor subunit TctC